MKTNMSEHELFTVSGRAAHLSNQALEDIALTVSEKAEFPARLSEALRMAFARSCFQLVLRSGTGNYQGFKDTVMQRVGTFYVRDFVQDADMKNDLFGTIKSDVESLGPVRSSALTTTHQQVAEALDRAPLVHP